jgi:hypothetical protein
LRLRVVALVHFAVRRWMVERLRLSVNPQG